MKHISIMKIFFILSVIASGLLLSCTETVSSDEQMDLINGDVDLKQEFYKSKFKNPMIISGEIKNKSKTEILAGVTITARLENSTTKYSTTSKGDGTYELYVEGTNTYIIYAEKVGYDKAYYFQTPNDSTTLISSNRINSVDIFLALYDPTPTFTVNHLGVKVTGKSMSDIAFNGTNLVSNYSFLSYVYLYDASGSYLKSSPFSDGMDFVACQDTVYWAGNYSGNTLRKIGQKGGKVINTITSLSNTINNVDIDVYENTLWLVTATQLFRVSFTGEVLMKVDFSKNIKDIKITGITHKDNYLFLLCNISGSYVLYKLDPATGTILSKGVFPSSLDNMAFKSLAYDQKNFWIITYGIYTSYSDLIKLSITE